MNDILMRFIVDFQKKTFQMSDTAIRSAAGSGIGHQPAGQQATWQYGK